VLVGAGELGEDEEEASGKDPAEAQEEKGDRGPPCRMTAW
jgi:hypothetical protein